MKNITTALLLFFIIQFSKAQEFITTWATINNETSISFNVSTTGPVSFTWETLPPATPASGVGSFQGPNATITGLPANVDFRLNIQPQNLKRFTLGNQGAFAFRLKEINQWGDVQWESFENAFNNTSVSQSCSLQVTASDIPDLSNVSSLKNMFSGCQSLNSPFNLNFWDISNVSNLSGMFRGCNNFNQALSQWDTSNVTDMSSMFEEARNFNQNIGTWNTSNVTDMSKMFRAASSFNNNIGNWDTSNVTNMSEMFNGNINSGFVYQFNVNISGWNTSNVTDMSGMFKGAVLFNQSIGNWNTSNVTNMSEMFKSAIAFNQNIGNWNTANVTDMSEMFSKSIFTNSSGSSTFNNEGSPLIGNWNTSNVTDFSNMFSGAEKFNHDLGSWSLAQAQNLTGMLDNSGLDCNRYSSTLIEWSINSSTPNNLILGASLLKYTSAALPAINSLLFTKEWSISGHDIVSTIPAFNIDTVYCEGEPATDFPNVSNDGINGIWSPAFNPNQTTTYTFTPNSNECALNTNLTITVLDSIEAPSGNSEQTASAGDTLEDLTIEPSSIIWYATLQDALDNTNPLTPNLPLDDGATYFAVNDNGQCRSEPFAINVSFSLNQVDNEFLNFNYYPNPVISELQIYNEFPIKEIKIYSISGQLMLNKEFNNTEISIDLNELPRSIYLVKIASDRQSNVIRIIKQ